MIRRGIGALVALTLTGVVPALASGVTVASSTLDTYQTCVLSGVSDASTVVADTWVNENSPDENSGSTTRFDVQSRTNRNRRAYVRFDLSLCVPGVPASATIVDAHVDLFITAHAAVCRTIDVFAISTSWSESAVTWNNQPVGTMPNNPPTSQLSASATIGADAPCTFTSTNVYASWTVTADVASWVSGATTNHGWMLRDDSENGSTARLTRFAASEADNAARAPRLVITYRP